KPDAAAGDTLEMAEQNDPVARELMQIEGVAAAGARDMRLAGKLRPWRRQLVHGAIVDPELVRPPVCVLAALAPGRAAGTTYREIAPSPGLIELLADLSAGLGAADHQHRALRQRLRVAVGIGMNLQHPGGKIGGECRDVRRLIEARCNND